MNQTTHITRGIGRTLGVVSVLLACLAGSSCKPDSEVFGGSITGTVFDLGAQPVGLVTVYVLDPDRGNEKADQVDALSGNNGHFRLDAPAGTWTLVATDFQGTAAFLYEVQVSNGEVVDVGGIYLAPCAAPGSGSNTEIYEECPDPSAEDYGYGTPPADYSLDVFEPEYTEANISDYPVSDDLLEVTSISNAQNVRIDMHIPASSPFYAVGVHEITSTAYGDETFFATLYELETGVMYVLQSGTFTVDAFEPVDGGQFQAHLSNAVFDWYDFVNGGTDSTFRATVGETAPAMIDTISVTLANQESGSPPPQSYVFTQLQPEFTQVYVGPDGSLSVGAYDTLSTEYVQLLIEIPPGLNAVGSFPVQNTFGSDPGLWDIELLATVRYTDALGYEYGYILESGVWTVSDDATGEGDTFSATLDQAVFQWQADPGAPPFATLTLEFQSSGTMSGVADASGGDGGFGGLDWTSLKHDLTTHLGN